MVEMGGVPTRATRRFIRLLSDEQNLPVYCFVDCDPYGFANIYRTLKVGSGNAAHINRFFCVPQARFLGVTPQDIVDFGLEDATHPLQRPTSSARRTRCRTIHSSWPTRVDRGDQAIASDGRSRRAAGAGQMGP